MSPVTINPDRPAERILDEDKIQPPARGLRRLALVVFLIIGAIPPLLILVPWRQNISSSGRVVAYNPSDRLMNIPAPISGRIVKIHVREGSRVKKGELLVEMADLDEFRLQRLQLERGFAEDKVNRKRDAQASLEREISALTSGRTFAISVATREYDSALETIEALREDIVGARADLEAKKEDERRQNNLFAKGYGSEKKAQKATADRGSAEAKVKSLEAKIRKAERERDAKEQKIEKVKADVDAKLESTRSKRDKAASEVAIAEKDLQGAESKLQKQSNQVVRAKRDGIVLRIHGAQSADYIKVGQPLVEFVPDTDDLAVEVLVKGNDAPLVTPGAPVRINFEGWPAIQFVGWPAVARGTFGGRVAVVDSQDDGKGNFRILVRPDPDDEPWPSQPFLRQGGRVKGWVLLQEVSLGYELWRQLNGFPPALKEAPTIGRKSGKKDG